MCREEKKKERDFQSSRGGSDDDDNISIIPSHLHAHYHSLFANLLPEEIAKVLNDTWISKNWELVAKKR